MTILLRIFALLLFATAVALPMWMPATVESQTEALTTDMDAKTDDLFNGFAHQDFSITQVRLTLGTTPRPLKVSRRDDWSMRREVTNLSSR